ncbi:3',5'-cyclic-nucleotide phosphodiesterase [Herbaspirillum hiltneri N3]|uniref:3',5'-cyclic-nucleotide phosphodiesterase n=1 Tax=Herbaspirillum hiltneri N3 TaxID=1262470 RepID=A0ABN4HQY1_9BURK|nr:3',5'-cyclic-nucleotide phosphodiesterase [Herbaspirillum hiltneri]AKZ61315.1 3',5'-cyclic-nucleotide phosphodiesterase [Herbaspirillum hiltneri N3]
MRVEILGCSGGIGGNTLRTTSLLVDNDILIDAGTGVNDLPLQALAAIDHVFITHSHLDHIACLPFILDSVGDLRNTPLTMHATQATQDIIRKHIFNWQIWPDFSEIPSPENPFLRFNTVEVGKSLVIGERSITALPANHTVPAVGYQLQDLGSGASLVFSGDTTSSDALWEMVNTIEDLRYLIIEAAFPDSERELAMLSRHFCPSLLLEDLAKLESDPEILVTHAKPGLFRQIESELLHGAGRRRISMLMAESVFEY